MHACDHSDMTRWLAALSALGVIGVAIAVVQLLPWPSLAGPPDFRPFVMTIEEWDSVRMRYSDGRTAGGTSIYRLEYQRRDLWTLTLVSDDTGAMAAGQGNACRNGAYGSIGPDSTFRVTSSDPGLCNGVPRWVHPGMACCYSWSRAVADGLGTYTSPGERVVFNLQTGLPLVYEAGPVGGAIGHRTVYRWERWLAGQSAPQVTCGTEHYEFGAGYDRQKRDCLSSAFAAGTPATFTSIHRATEGASLTYTAVVNGPTQVEVTFENAAVGANGGTFVYACAALERKPINEQPSWLSFAATKCSGRGPEVVF